MGLVGEKPVALFALLAQMCLLFFGVIPLCTEFKFSLDMNILKKSTSGLFFIYDFILEKKGSYLVLANGFNYRDFKEGGPL